MTTLHLMLLLHYHCIAEPWGQPEDAPAVIEYTKQLIRKGLIVKSLDSGSGFEATPKGIQLIQTLNKSGA